MNDYILLMHSDAADRARAVDDEQWGAYISLLRGSGQFDGGSSMGAGECVQKNQPGQPADRALTGFIRVRAINLTDARRFLVGNPVYEAGGTVEIRVLPKDT